MVRLEDLYFLQSKVGRVRFQFHYGTIGSTSAIIAVVSYLLFQFHYGTIGRLTGKIAKAIQRFNFNSTMVRLEAPICYFQYFTCIYFNSTMVRLEVRF